MLIKVVKELITKIRILISVNYILKNLLYPSKSGVSDCFRQEDGNMYVVYQMPLIQDKKLVGAIYCECNIQKFYKETLFAFMMVMGELMLLIIAMGVGF